MNVELIDYTGAESRDNWYAARLLIYTKNTRLEQTEDTRAKVRAMGAMEIYKELEYIANTIRSSWEFVDFTFQINNVTRAFTHQLVRTRTASYAQQAQRVVDMGEFKALVPDTVKKAGVHAHATWHSCMDTIAETYQTLQKAGIPNQDCRGVLPTNVLTNIIMKLNLRTFADLLAKRKSLRAQGEYRDVVFEMERLAMIEMPWLGPFLSPDRTATPAMDSIFQEMLGSGSPIDNPRLNAALKELDKLKGTWG